jgi:hypothetical protein
LVTETKHIADIRSLLKTELEMHYTKAFKLNFPKKNTQAFLNILSISIFSRCFVCLDQLELNEHFTSNKFQVNEYSRKQLICDMDKKINLLRSAKSYMTDML